MFDQLIAIVTGIVIGFGMAVPVGPVGLIIFQRSIVKSRLMGFITGFGSALTDGFLASIGAFGMRIILDFIVEQELTLRLVGGIILLLVGLFGIFSKYKPIPKHKDSAITYLEHFFSGIILTATNPLSAMAFFVIFAGIGHKLGIRHAHIATSLVLGVVIGSLLWWITLTYIADRLGHKIKTEHIGLMNQCFGIIIAIIGMAFLISAIF